MAASPTCHPLRLQMDSSDIDVGPKNHVLDGVEIPHWKGQFSWVVRPTEKIWESMLRCTQQKASFNS